MFNHDYGDTHQKNRRLIEPIENFEVDVSHWFAVIDSTRNINRDFPVMIGFYLASWLGDLHQATYARNTENLKKLPVNFKTDVLECYDSFFSMDDFVADVDGYNIGFAILTNNKNKDLKVSDSINGYYEILKKDYKNRYRIFIKSLSFYTVSDDADETASDIVKDYVDKTPVTGINGFIYNVCKYMGINYNNYSDYGETLYYNDFNPIFHFMCNKNGISRGYPCGTLRINMAMSFIDYILEMAGYNYEDEE